MTHPAPGFLWGWTRVGRGWRGGRRGAGGMRGKTTKAGLHVTPATPQPSTDNKTAQAASTDNNTAKATQLSGWM